MCQQIIQFCSGSIKPLLFVGSLLLILAAIAIGYIGYDANALYEIIDLQKAQENYLSYYLQLAVAAYLTLVTVLAAFAAHYDQKQMIRALTLITSVNFVVAVVALFLVPNPTQVYQSLEGQLAKAQESYNFSGNGLTITNQTGQVISQTDVNALNVVRVFKLNETDATKIWDSLQKRGCCGLKNATMEWKEGLPKSCCAAPQSLAGKFICKDADQEHSRPCVEIIGATGMNLLIALAFIALVNLYLATVTGISTCRTFHYNEASQSAYT